MSYRLPPSWDRMTAHARACYLVDSHQAKDYRDACIKVGRMEAEKRRRITVMQYQETMEKRGLD